MGTDDSRGTREIQRGFAQPLSSGRFACRGTRRKNMRAVAQSLIAGRALLAARSRFGERELDAAISRGATQHVIVGAGLDTFAYRTRNPNLRVFEVEERSLSSALEGAGFLAGEVSFFSWF